MSASENPPTTNHYPEVIALEGLRAGEHHVQPEVEGLTATPEAYLELEAESRELQQALDLDFDRYASELPQEELLKRAKPELEKLNQYRPNDPVNIEIVSPAFLRHLIRPKWHEHFPTDTSKESEQKWKGFVESWPEHIQSNLEELHAVDEQLHGMAADQPLMQEVSEIRSERIEVMRQASTFLVAERRQKVVTKQMATVHQVAALSDRALTKAENRRLQHFATRQEDLQEKQRKAVTSGAVIDEIARRRALQDRRDLKQGLLLTSQMQEIIDELLPSLLAGKPALLVGETGGAKTALAEFLSRRYMDKEPLIISGYGDVNSYQLMGKATLQEKNGVPVSEFAPGPVIRAMEEGRPLILDEINAMPADFLKRLNKIVQLRPSDTFEIQEDSGKSVTIRSGFCIVATANEKSKRYKGVEDLSVEFQNRFGSNVVRVHYPDYDVPDGMVPKDNLRLALAILSDRTGTIDASIDQRQLGYFVRAAHITQKVFSEVATAEHATWVDTEAIRDRQPGLQETVIAPRTMVDILTKVKDSHGSITIERALQRFVSGIKNPKDKKVITTILQGHHFLQDKDEAEQPDDPHAPKPR